MDINNSVKAIRFLLLEFLSSIPTNNMMEAGIIKSYHTRIMVASDNEISEFMNSIIKPKSQRILNKDRIAILSVIQDIPFSDRIDEKMYQHLVDYLIKIVYLIL